MAHTYAFVIADSPREAEEKFTKTLRSHLTQRAHLQAAVDTHRVHAPAVEEGGKDPPKVVRLLVTVVAAGR